jgi:pilus assembly protein CpaC
MKRCKWLSIVLSCIGLVGTPWVSAQAQGRGAAEEGNEIGLAVGETATISARDIKNYSEGVAGVVDVKLTTDGSKFVIVGRRPGSTTLLLIKTDGAQRTININVFTRSPALVEKELAELLKGLNVTTRRIGAQIVIDGTVADESELKRVAQVAALYPGQVMSLARLPAAETGAPGAPGPAVRRGKSEHFLIRIDFYFVQYDKNSSYGIGIGWPETIGAGATAEVSHDFLIGSTRSATASVAGQPLPRLDIASGRGWAKVLKQATVITDNDAQASFQNGGEQNYPVNTGLTIGIEKVTYGIDLKVLPHYDPEKKDLGLKLEADISDLTSSVSGTSLPGRTTSNITTTVSLKLGQSLILSGIHTQSLTHSVTGLPGLSEIPVLGVLFGSHSQARALTEGAIFVVPSVVQTVPSSSAELVDIALQKFENYSGDLSSLQPYDRRPGGGVGVPR